jgi:hypothetical protein
MIKLTIHPESNSISHSFEKGIVLIGASPDSDLSLQNEKLQSMHVKIAEQENHFIIINQANDPFVTLNGIPFGKKQLNHFDLIQIGQTLIRFEGELSSNTFEQKESESLEKNKAPRDTKIQAQVSTQNLTEILDAAMHSRVRNESQASSEDLEQTNISSLEKRKSENEPFFSHRYENEIEEVSDFLFSSKNEEFFEENPDYLDINAMVEEAENLEYENSKILMNEDEVNSLFSNTHSEIPIGSVLNVKQPLSTEKPIFEENVVTKLSNIPLSPSQRPSLKEYYLHEFDDENENFNVEKDVQPPPSLSKINNKLKFTIYCIAAVLTLILIIITVIYLAISDKSGDEEMKAAEGVADVAMALSYAQINQIKPNKQNWSDPDFIKNNLTAVLSNTYPSLSNIDPHGQFCNCPYILRIYTSGDLSKFLVIAQPAPSLWQWIVPKPAIIVDSKTMEMRKTKDIKILNRLLVNASTLDGTNAMEISFLVKQGELVPLSTLAKNTRDYSFSPPKALAMLRPGAENLVYNAPRYYHFGESLLNKALQLNKVGTSHDVLVLQQEMANLTHFPHMILYSSQGLQSAIEAQLALSTFAPQKKFMIAYLKFNSKGLVTGSHLLIDPFYDKTKEEGAHPINMLHTVFTAAKTAKKNSSESLTDTGEIHGKVDSEIDENNPLFLQLNAIATSRQNALKPIGEEISHLIYKQTMEGVPGFPKQIHELLDTYETINEEQRIKTSKALNKLHQEHPELSMAQNMNYIQAAGLEAFVQENLKIRFEAQDQNWLSANEINAQQEKIKDSTNWEEFEKNVLDTAKMLTLKQMPNADRLITFQKSTRSVVLKKLEHFLLSSKSPIPLDQFGPQQRISLINILKSAWISEPNEQAFYLNEFDLHSQKNPNSKNFYKNNSF